MSVHVDDSDHRGEAQDPTILPPRGNNQEEGVRRSRLFLADDCCQLPRLLLHGMTCIFHVYDNSIHILT